MIQTIRKAWGIPELRKKIIFTLLILLIFRIGNAITVPYVDVGLLETYLDQMGGTILGLYNVMSGGAFAQATVFALSIQPYINASIIIQLLTVAIPALERLAKDGGEEGRKKIQSITRYTTVGIAILQAVGYYFMMRNYNLLASDATGIWPALVIVVSFIAGSSFVMWMGEQVTEFGIGNGISIILFAGILSRIPTSVSSLYSGVVSWANGGAAADGALHPALVVLLLVGVLALVVFVVFISDAERRIPVQYAKRQVGRKMYGGQSSHLPMKVNMSGVLPIIFAQSIASLPVTIWTFIGIPEEETVSRAIYDAIDTQSFIYMIVYFIMIIGFSYFYSTIQFNPVEIANNLKKQGGFIPGFRPGKPTVDFIKKVLSKITLFGAIYLGIVAICPLLLGKAVGNAYLAIGGTSVIIVVGVALETVKALEAQMLMRQYKGTQAEILCRELSIPTISTGNILRAAIKNGTPTGLKAKSYMDAGQLVPDDVIIGIVTERLAEDDCKNGYILDGVPRTIAQAAALEKAGITFDDVISIEISDETIMERMSGRRVCESCGASYHMVAVPPKQEGVCDKCGGKLVQRKDDAPETVKARLEVYHKETEPLKDFYAQRGLLKPVENQPSVEETSRAILHALGR